MLQCVYRDVINGIPQSIIEEKLKNDEYGVGKKYESDNLKFILLSVKRMIMSDFENEKPLLKQKLYAQINDVYQDAKTAKDRANALKSIELIMKLTGLNEPNKQIEINTNSNTGVVKIKFGLSNDDEEDVQSEIIEDAEVIDEKE